MNQFQFRELYEKYIGGDYKMKYDNEI